VYQVRGNNFEHVLIYSKSSDVFMALVNDLEATAVYGHCLLDFKKINDEKT